MKKVIKLTESDLTRIVKRVLIEQQNQTNPLEECFREKFEVDGTEEIPQSCINALNAFMEGDIMTTTMYAFSCGSDLVTNVPVDDFLKKFKEIQKCVEQKGKVSH